MENGSIVWRNHETHHTLYGKYNFAHQIKIFSRARPELVEGYLRALEDTLQQVQGDRKGHIQIRST